MRSAVTALSFIAAALQLSSCASSEMSSHTASSGSPSSSVFIDSSVINSVNPSNARIEIDISEQKARLFRVVGHSTQLALETRVSTGMPGHETPTGNFHILEKMAVKDSNLYGIWVDGQTGALLDRDGDSRSRPSGGRAQFQGSPMPYWLKVHPGGAGMHVGYVAGHPVSHGCIRVPQQAQALIFERAAVGTPVVIRP